MASHLYNLRDTEESHHYDLRDSTVSATKDKMMHSSTEHQNNAAVHTQAGHQHQHQQHQHQQQHKQQHPQQHPQHGQHGRQQDPTQKSHTEKIEHAAVALATGGEATFEHPVGPDHYSGHSDH
ncbi:hypothetical protein FBU30_004561 [Linnemannia zychae]|nr:hypothetical protein FBU30_004561 [Linnemannia zychae]